VIATGYMKNGSVYFFSSLYACLLFPPTATHTGTPISLYSNLSPSWKNFRGKQSYGKEWSWHVWNTGLLRSLAEERKLPAYVSQEWNNPLKTKGKNLALCFPLLKTKRIKNKIKWKNKRKGTVWKKKMENEFSWKIGKGFSIIYFSFQI
jgi:hypothetical protein